MYEFSFKYQNFSPRVGPSPIAPSRHDALSVAGLSPILHPSCIVSNIVTPESCASLSLTSEDNVLFVLVVLWC